MRIYSVMYTPTFIFFAGVFLLNIQNHSHPSAYNGARNMEAFIYYIKVSKYIFRNKLVEKNQVLQLYKLKKKEKYLKYIYKY